MPLRILEPTDIVIAGGAAVGWLPEIIENFSTIAAGSAATVATILGALKIYAFIGRLRDEQEQRDP